jgi:hypothetical protein
MGVDNLKHQICAYCGKPSDDLTKDHVVPLGLWIKGQHPQHPVVVPACRNCIDSPDWYDREATYFRNCLVSMIDMDAHPMAGKLLRGPVVRSIERRPGVMRDCFHNFRRMERKTDAGIIVGTGWAFDIDMTRFNRIVEKIVRGFFYFKSGIPLPKTHEVVIFPGNGFWKLPDFQSLLENMEPFAGLGDDVFMCRALRDANDTFLTAWIFMFFQNIGVFAWSEKIEVVP